MKIDKHILGKASYHGEQLSYRIKNEMARLDRDRQREKQAKVALLEASLRVLRQEKEVEMLLEIRRRDNAKLMRGKASS